MTAARCALLCACALLALPATASAQGKATIKYYQRGTSGKVETRTDVIVQQDGYAGVTARGMSTLTADRVISIRYSKEPKDYRQAQQHFSDRAYAEAIPLFEKSLEQASKYDWLTAYANWFAGTSYRRLGDLKSARNSYQACLDKAATSRFAPLSMAALAEIGFIQSDSATAKRWYGRLADLAKRKGLGATYENLAEFGLARVEARFGDPAGGLASLKKIQAATEDSSIKNKCALEIGQTYIRQKNYSQARTYFQTIANSANTDDPDPEMIAGSSNGLGDCLRELQKYDEALMSYSRVFALFHDRAEMRSQVAHALYWGGKACDALSGLAKDDDQKKLLRRRALKLWHRADREFKGTAGGELARKQIGR